MSTLTKVLIILLTIASIFLCGIVVTYVANAVDYKQKYDGLYIQYQAAKKNEDNAKTQLNNTIEEKNRATEKLKEQIALLEEEIAKLNGELANAERQRDDANRRKDSWEAIVMDFSKTIENNEQLLKDAIAMRDKKDKELIKQGKELNETTEALIEKLAIIDQLGKETRRLREENTALLNKLDQFLRQYGKVVAPPVLVTPIKEKVRVAPPTKDIGLKGLITNVDLKKLLAEISIGEADGVKEGMRFHATRGDRFICDVVILDVEPESAIGWLELLQKSPQDQPRVGDNVSTNL